MNNDSMRNTPLNRENHYTEAGNEMTEEDITRNEEWEASLAADRAHCARLEAACDKLLELELETTGEEKSLDENLSEESLHLMEGFYSLATGLGLEVFYEVPATLLKELTMRGIERNEDIGKVILEFTRMAMVAYANPLTNAGAVRLFESTQQLAQQGLDDVQHHSKMQTH